MIKKQRLIISFVDLNIILIYVFFLKPSFIEDFVVLDYLFNAVRFGLTIYYGFKMFFSRKKITYGCFFLFLLFCTVFISTVLHQGRLYMVLGHYVPALGLTVWINMNRDRIERIIQIFYRLGCISIVINFITILMFSEGIYKRNTYMPVWFLGQKQDFIFCILSTVCFGVICGCLETNKYKKSMPLMILVAAASMIIVKPMGLLICVAVIAIMIFMDRYIYKAIDMRILFGINIAFLIIGILFANAYENMGWAKQFLSNFLNTGLDKSYTLGIRFSMWMYAYDMFTNNILLGIGQVTEEVWYHASGLPYYHTIVHNFYLDMALTGGAIAICLFVMWNLKIVKQVNEIWNVKIARYIGYIFFAMQIICLVECPYHPLFLSLYVFMAIVLSLVKKSNNKKNIGAQ